MSCNIFDILNEEIRKSIMKFHPLDAGLFVDNWAMT